MITLPLHAILFAETGRSHVSPMSLYVDQCIRRRRRCSVFLGIARLIRRPFQGTSGAVY